MIHTQNQKTVIFNGPGTEATNATNAASIDTIGYKHCRIEVALPPATATNSSATWTSLVLQHGTTTDPTNCTAIATGGTDFTIPAFNDTAVAGIVGFDVDLSSRQRILRVVAQCPASHSTVTYTAIFDRLTNQAGDATNQGAGKFQRVTGS